MSRYIDADALKKAVEDFPNCYNGWSDAYDKAFIIGAIEEAPTIDAVSVVRCKECKWADKCSQNVAILETYDMYEKLDFCSHGERSDNGKDIQSATE